MGKKEKDPHAVHLGRLGGNARRRKLTSEQRREIARKAAQTRWSGGSCEPFLAAEIRVELAEQCVAVFLGPVRQVRDKAFYLLAGGFAASPDVAEIDGVGLDEV